MLRYSLLMLVLAHCAVNGLQNDGDPAKSARLVSAVRNDEILPKPVVGLPTSNDQKLVTNATQGTNVAEPVVSALADSALTSAAQDTKPSHVVQNADIAEMGDDKIIKDSTDEFTDAPSVVLAHSAVNGQVNNGDPAKGARLVSVVTNETLPQPVVGLPTSDDKKVDTAEMGDAKIIKDSTDELTEAPSVVDQKSEPTIKPTADVHSPAKPSDVKSPTPASDLDNKDASVSNKDGEHPVSGNSGKKPLENSDNQNTPPTSSLPNTETKPSENGTESESSKPIEGPTKPTTVSTEQPQTEVTASSSASSSITTAGTSATAESVSTPSTTSNATTMAASAAGVEAKPEDEGMSSGTVALVMAIVFAIVVVIVYVGLLLWRRYLEYRYGTRELLVNDLEFDTNDLRHFEL